MPLYDFLCPDGHKSEHITSWMTAVQDCPVCGKPAKRQVTYGKGTKVIMGDPPVKLTGWRKGVW